MQKPPSKRLLLWICIWALGILAPGSIPPKSNPQESWKFSDKSLNWARSVLDTLTIDEKIGQLFMIPVYSNRDSVYLTRIVNQLLLQKVGGLICMQGSPHAQLKLANQLQGISDLPLLIAQDAEWGLQMRLDSVIRFPHALTLGAIQSDSLIFLLGLEMAKHCRASGVQVNFSPVADINNNPQNPVINDRSFGEIEEQVSKQSIAMMRGLQAGKVLACAKHFPGHGDTDTDSHLDLPLIPYSQKRLDSLELIPFRKLFAAGIGSCMVGHLYLPLLDPTPHQASTLSPLIVQGLLKQSLNFQGLIFTDALNMKGVSKYYKEGDAEVQALIAGNDILLFPDQLAKAREKIHLAIREGKLSISRIDSSVLKILAMKHFLGLDTQRWSSPRIQANALLNPHTIQLKQNLFDQAITLVRNRNQTLPFSKMPDKLLTIELQCSAPGKFSACVSRYAPLTSACFPFEPTTEEILSLKEKVRAADQVIISVQGMSSKASKSYGLSIPLQSLISSIEASHPSVTTVWFGNPYALKFEGSAAAVLVAYEEDTVAMQSVADVIWGAIPAMGALPVSAGIFPAKASILTQPIRPRLYSSLLNPSFEKALDSIVYPALYAHTFPGCAILVAHKNNLLLAKGYGQFTYEPSSTSVNPWTTQYDLASLTKVCATTLACMHLVQNRKLALDSSMTAYLPELRKTKNGTITLRNLLLHTSGLPASLPLSSRTLTPTQNWKPEIYQSDSSSAFPLQIAPKMYQVNGYEDSVFHATLTAPRSTPNTYVYSDLNMICLQRIIERVTHQSLAEYCEHNFYQPLGMHTTGFCPGKKGLAQNCPPTEMDQSWRKQVIQGYVHDPMAAMLGGVSGNAGLFSSVTDLGKLFQMLMRNGIVGKDTFLSPAIIQEFTRTQPGSYRGLGWDKPGPNSIAATACSPSTFGHTGFTGTCVWADPENDLLFIFLSNRTYPSAENRKLIQDKIRTRIHQLIYSELKLNASASIPE